MFEGGDGEGTAAETILQIDVFLQVYGGNVVVVEEEVGCGGDGEEDGGGQEEEKRRDVRFDGGARGQNSDWGEG